MSSVGVLSIYRENSILSSHTQFCSTDFKLISVTNVKDILAESPHSSE